MKKHKVIINPLQLLGTKAVAPYIFVLPYLILFLVFVAFPILDALYISFHHWSILRAPKFVSVHNYTRLLKDELFWISLRNTAYYTFCTVPLGIAASLSLALMMNRKFRTRGLFRSIYFFPAVISMVVVALIWQFMFDRYDGIINAFLESMGIQPISWLTDPKWAMPAIIIMSVWKGVGYNMVIFLAGLQSIPPELYEAARIDGAGEWQCFKHVTLPLLSPITFFILIMSMIGSFKVFDQIYVMTQGGPANATMVLVQYIYQEGFMYFKMGYASAVAYVLFAIILVLTIVQFKFFGSRAQLQY